MINYRDYENYYKSSTYKNKYEEDDDYISFSSPINPRSSFYDADTSAYNSLSRLKYDSKPQTTMGKYMLKDYEWKEKQLRSQQKEEEDGKTKRKPYEELFDLLQIGQYTVMGALSGIADGEGGLNPFVGAAKGFTQGLSILPFWEGWKEPADYQASRDVLPHLGWEKEENPDGKWYNPATWSGNNIAQSVAGFILDVALDPATYFTLGGSALLKGGAGLAPDVATKIGANVAGDVATKAGANIAGDVASKFGDDVAEIVSKGLSGDEALEAISKVVKEKGLSRPMAEEIVKATYARRGLNLTDEILQKEADIAYKKINQLIGRSTVEKPLSWGLPFMKKYEIIPDAVIRQFSDKTPIPKAWNKVVETFYTTPVGKAFSTNTGLRALAKENPAKVYEFFHVLSDVGDLKSALLRKPEFIEDLVKTMFGDTELTPAQLKNITKALDSKRTIKYINKITNEIFGGVDEAIAKDPVLRGKVDEYVGKKKDDIKNITEEVGIMKQQREAIQKEMDDILKVGDEARIEEVKKIDEARIEEVKKIQRDNIDYAHVEEDYINTLEYINKKFKRKDVKENAYKSVFDKRVDVDEVMNKVNQSVKVEDVELVKKALENYNPEQYKKFAKGGLKPDYKSITTGEKIFASKGSGEIDELDKLAKRIFSGKKSLSDASSNIVKGKRQSLIDAINNSIFGGERIIDSELFGYNIDKVLETIGEDIAKVSSVEDVQAIARKLAYFKNHALKKQAIFQYVGKDLGYKNILDERMNIFEQISKELPPHVKDSAKYKRLEEMYNTSKKMVEGVKTKGKILTDDSIIYDLKPLYDGYVRGNVDDSLAKLADEKFGLFSNRKQMIQDLGDMPNELFWKEHEKLTNDTLTGVKYKNDYDAIDKTFSDMNRTMYELNRGDVGVGKKSNNNLRSGDFTKEDYAELKKWHVQNEANRQAWVERQKLLESQETILTPSDYDKMIDLQKQGLEWKDIVKSMKNEDKTFNITKEVFNARTETLNELLDIKAKLKQVDSRFKTYKKQISYAEKSSLRGVDSELKEIDNMLKEYQKQLSIAEKAGKSTDDIFNELDTLADLQDDLLAKRDKLVSSGYKDTDKAKPFLNALDELANMQDNLLARQDEIIKSLPTDSDKLVNPKNFYESKSISSNTGGYKKTSQRAGYAGTLDETGADYMQQLASKNVDEISTASFGKKTYNEVNPRYADLNKEVRVAKNLTDLKKIDAEYYTNWMYKNGKQIPSDLHKKTLQSFKGKVDLQMSKLTNKEFKSFSEVKEWIRDVDIKRTRLNEMDGTIKQMVDDIKVERIKDSQELKKYLSKQELLEREALLKNQNITLTSPEIAYLRKERNKLYKEITSELKTNSKKTFDDTIDNVNKIIDESNKFSDKMQDIITRRNQIKDYIRADIDVPMPPRSSKARAVKIGDDTISKGWTSVKENVTGDGWELLVKASDVDSALAKKHGLKRVGDMYKVPYEMTNIVRDKTSINYYKNLYKELTSPTASRKYATENPAFQSTMKQLEAKKAGLQEIRNEITAKRADDYAKSIVGDEKTLKSIQQISKESSKLDVEIDKIFASSSDAEAYAELSTQLKDINTKVENLAMKKIALENEITDKNIENIAKQFFDENDYIQNVEGLDEVENAIYDNFRKSFNEMARKEVELGLLTDAQRKAMSERYLPHILTKEGLDNIKKGNPLFDEFMGREGKFAFGKERFASKGQSVFDFNDAVGIEAFSEDLASIYLVRSLKSQEAIYNETFMRKMVKDLGDDFILRGNKLPLKADHTITTTYGQLNRALSNHVKERISSLNKAIKTGKGLHEFDDDIAKRLAGSKSIKDFLTSEYDRVINEVMDDVGLSLKNKDMWNKPMIELTEEQATKLNSRFNLNTKQVHNAIVEKMNLAKDIEITANSNALIQTYDKFLKLYKANLTSIYPGFHARNAVSNQFQNFLGIGNDVLDPVMQKNATLALTNIDKVKNELLTDGYTWGRVVELAEQEELISKGLFNSDIMSKTDLEKVGMRTKDGISYLDNKAGNWNPLDLQGFKPYQVGANVGGFIEGRDRLIHFASRLKAGDSVDEAVDSVNKFLFDYNDLTKFEHNVMKRLVPFYTWMRKNTALQAEMVLERPEIYRNLDKIHNMIEGGVSDEEMIDKEELPSYMQDFLQITPNTMFNPNMPYEDLNIADNISTNILTPPIKIPLELTTGKTSGAGTYIQNQHPWQNATKVFSADTGSEKVQRILKLLSGLSFTDVKNN